MIATLRAAWFPLRWRYGGRVLAIAVIGVGSVSNGQSQLCSAQFATLVGTPELGIVGFGSASAMSGDGNTILVMAPFESASQGAAYVFTRTGSGSATTWTAQGPRLTPSGASGAGGFGVSAAISSNGNTAIFGAPGDNGGVGAAYVFVRTGTAWSQQGAKLTPTGGVGAGNFGVSVSISGDGDTAIIGANADNQLRGAVYVFTRSGGAWTQQGTKLVANTIYSGVQFGESCAISADASTLAIGARYDGESVEGSVYFYTRSGGSWVPQGNRVDGPTGPGFYAYGAPVSLSSDGGTALVGSISENNGAGAAYLLTRTGTGAAAAWTRSPCRLFPVDMVGQGLFGSALSLSPDGRTAIVGAPEDNGYAGAVFVFVRVDSGSSSNWLQSGPKLATSANLAQFGRSVACSGDGRTIVAGATGNYPGKAFVYGLGVDSAIVFTQHPVGLFVPAGTTANFVTGATSASPLAYRWRRNGVALVDGLTSEGSMISGSGTPSLSISPVVLVDNAAAYDCLVSNGCTSKVSNPAGLAVSPRCRGDLNRDDMVSLQDLFDYLVAYFSPCP